MGAATAALDHQTTPYGHHGPDPRCRWGRGSGNTVTERPGSPPEVLGLNCITLLRDSTPKIDRRAPPPTPGMAFDVRRSRTRDRPLEPRSMVGTESLGVLFRRRVKQLHKHNPEPPGGPGTPTSHTPAQKSSPGYTQFQAAGRATAVSKRKRFRQRREARTSLASRARVRMSLVASSAYLLGDMP